ncbi:MAG TPA: lysophospholipid acyltransferase family protein [Terriglobia bacterium]|nr:lysophospholipid acyltransferase family protein [Terriglobia bacterium]
MLRSIFVTIVTFAYILLIGPWFLIYALLTGRTDALYGCGRWGAKLSVWLAGIKLEVLGLEQIPKGRAVLFMPNHQSLSDGPAVFGILPPVLAIAKKEFFKVPVLGRAMMLRGFVPLDRGNRERAIQAVEEAAKSLRAGNSFLAFPEGTRSPDGRLQAFKKGVFVMAIKAEAPIVPISISGSRKIMRKNEWAMHPGPIRITFHAPIPTAGFTMADRAMIMERVRQAILSGLSRDEWPEANSGG